MTWPLGPSGWLQQGGAEGSKNETSRSLLVLSSGWAMIARVKAVPVTASGTVADMIARHGPAGEAAWYTTNRPTSSVCSISTRPRPGAGKLLTLTPAGAGPGITDVAAAGEAVQARPSASHR